MVEVTRRSVMAGSMVALCGRALAQGGLRDLAVPIPSLSFVSAGVRAAGQLGLFSRQGIDLHTVTMDSGNAVTSALISGFASVILGGPGEFVAAQARGQPVVVIVDAYRGFGASLVLTSAAIKQTGISARLLSGSGVVRSERGRGADEGWCATGSGRS